LIWGNVLATPSPRLRSFPEFPGIAAESQTDLVFSPPEPLPLVREHDGTKKRKLTDRLGYCVISATSNSFGRPSLPPAPEKVRLGQ